jgi:hypothetical protein
LFGGGAAALGTGNSFLSKALEKGKTLLSLFSILSLELKTDHSPVRTAKCAAPYIFMT